MNKIKQILGTTAGFIVIYILVMIPTYILPYFSAAGAIAGVGAALATGSAASGGLIAFLPKILHFACLAILVYACVVRGKVVGKSWLMVFPILALIFDLVPFLNFIPFVPTIMHILAIILGTIGVAKVNK